LVDLYLALRQLKKESPVDVAGAAEITAWAFRDKDPLGQQSMDMVAGFLGSGTGDLGISDGSFKTVTVVGSGAIDVRGGKFGVLSSNGAGGIDIRGGKFSVGLGSSGAAKISVAGGDFDQLVASGSGDLGISDGSFKTVTVTGSGAIDVLDPALGKHLSDMTLAKVEIDQPNYSGLVHSPLRTP
jgi:hypothetical protein